MLGVVASLRMPVARVALELGTAFLGRSPPFAACVQMSRRQKGMHNVSSPCTRSQKAQARTQLEELTALSLKLSCPATRVAQLTTARCATHDLALRHSRQRVAATHGLRERAFRASGFLCYFAAFFFQSSCNIWITG